MLTVAQLARLTGNPYMTTMNQMKRGWCPWPRRSRELSSFDPAYKCWENMLQRCSNPCATGYGTYGGRGIVVDPRFKCFRQFIEHMGPRPSAQHSIDRIDVNGNYAPGNVRWATSHQQAQNKRPDRRVWRVAQHGKKFRFSYKGNLYTFNTYEEAGLWLDAKIEGSW